MLVIVRISYSTRSTAIDPIQLGCTGLARVTFGFRFIRFDLVKAFPFYEQSDSVYGNRRKSCTPRARVILMVVTMYGSPILL